MAFDVNEFISLKPIIDQLQSNPNSKIKISKSQSSILANMSEEKFNSFLEMMKKPLSAPNPPANASIIVENIESIRTTRDQRLAARINTKQFVQAAEIKVEKQKISNFLNSQKNAVNFLKQEGKPFSFLNEPYFKAQSSSRVQSSRMPTNEIRNKRKISTRCH